ncbi:MAG: hypothetical protein VX963_04585 [Actinomycetota bacterium]|nr:hypothetical protein [Actinomycetota bacterium]
MAGQLSKTHVIVQELEYDPRASRMWFGDGVSKGVISFLPLASRPKISVNDEQRHDGEAILRGAGIGAHDRTVAERREVSPMTAKGT